MPAQPAASLLIVYHSTTGGARQMAEAAARAAREHGPVTLLQAHAAGPEALLAAAGYLFVMPEHLASMSGVMKDFFDRCYYAVLDRIGGRPYAAMVCAGSDGEGAARQVERICRGWRLQAVAPHLIVCTHAQSPEEILRAKHIPEDELARCAELGGTLAAGLALGIY